MTRVVEEGDVVVAEGMVRSALHNGGVLSLVFCDVFVMRDGLVRQLTSYLMPMAESEVLLDIGTDPQVRPPEFRSGRS